MAFDLYEELSRQQCYGKKPIDQYDLVSGYVDYLTVVERAGKKVCLEGGKRKDARDVYRQDFSRVAVKLPEELNLDLEPRVLRSDWVSIAIHFQLMGSWYSKDDRLFHVLDNPVRKDRVFGVPYMAAASWKGLLRWAMGMRLRLIGPNPITDGEERRQAERMIRHLFGNEKGVEESFQRGALAFYPTWFVRIGFEVINPHCRAQRAGTRPILYEVVPSGTKGKLTLLYAPRVEVDEGTELDPVETLRSLLDAARDLLEVYGFSAKRTAGWGVAKIEEVKAVSHAGTAKGTLQAVKDKLSSLLRGGGGA